MCGQLRAADRGYGNPQSRVRCPRDRRGSRRSRRHRAPARVASAAASPRTGREARAGAAPSLPSAVWPGRPPGASRTPARAPGAGRRTPGVRSRFVWAPWGGGDEQCDLSGLGVARAGGAGPRGRSRARLGARRRPPGSPGGLSHECWGTWTRTKNDGTRNRCVANYTIPQKACGPSVPVVRGTVIYCTASRRSARPPTRSRCTAAAVIAPCPAATMSCSGPGGVTSPTA